MNIHESEQVDYRPHDEVTQTIVDAVQLFAPASPLVALRVVYFSKREVPEVQQFYVRGFPEQQMPPVSLKHRCLHLLK